MLEDFISEPDFAKVMKKNIQDFIIYLFEKDRHFGVLCNIKDVGFSPELPEEILSQFHAMTLFYLAAYTFESARIEDDMLVFEAGFGADNFGSVVSVPLLSIVQIIIDDQPVLINLAKYQKEEKVVKKEVDDKGIENSMNIFLSNPDNSKFLK
ncbi:hypothetical protein [Sulfurimonas sp.]|uniref:hypothetical protein n=1 Tax=Sulfurimonas sp. TaxID=2022749 RepID=UPI0035672085